MESSFLLLRARPFTGRHSFPLPSSRPIRRLPSSSIAPSALKSPRGFGGSTAKTLKQKQGGGEEENKSKKKKKLSDEDEEEDDDEDVAIPEVVTNRMMRRMGLSVGIPVTVGLLFFPLFYYLKVVAKVDVPNWVPFIFSFVFFGTALLGVSYGIVSASWDPLREGSLLGWKEARRNWPLFWDSLWGGGTSTSSRNK